VNRYYSTSLSILIPVFSEKTVAKKLLLPSYWENTSYLEWDLKGWTDFIHNTTPNKSLRTCRNFFVEELKTLKENLTPETREARKVIALIRSLKVSVSLTKSKHFAEGVEANEIFNFYVAPQYTVTKLYQYLIKGYYIYVKGNRQSGKTTSIIAAINLLLEKSNANELPVPDLEIYVITFGVGIDIRNGKMAFWKNKAPVSFIIDDFSNIFEEPVILEELIHTLQFLKNRSTYCVHSFALVGVDEIKMLLNQYSDQYGVNLDINEIVEDIFECTNGHKGLVGACCKAIETEVIIGENKLSFDQWIKYSSTRLIKFIKELGTYKSIVRVIKDLSLKQMDIIGSVKCNDDDEIYRLLAEGIVVSETIDEDYVEIKCSSPILPKSEIDIQWLLENTVENLAVQNIFARQALNADNNPSEYAFQAEFSAVLKYLLSNVYPVLQYRVIVEAKKRDINGNRRKRLDIFLCGHNLPTYGFELVVNKKNYEEHLDCANYYRNLHGCSMYIVNLCTNFISVDMVESRYPEVTLVNIMYDINNRMADIDYYNSKKLLLGD
ncbi:18837_t:CDS:2, partial [Racocetra persica]